MAANTIQFPDKMFFQKTAIITTNETTILTSDASNDRIITIFAASSDDTTGQNMTLYKVSGGTSYPIDFIAVPITAGTATNHAVNVLYTLSGSSYNVSNMRDKDGNLIMQVPAGVALSAKLSAIVSNKTVWVRIEGYQTSV